MRTVYQTLDGETFFDALDAEQHESELLSRVKMWGWGQEPTTDTTLARVVFLEGEGAGKIFKAMVAANPAEEVELADYVIDDEDHGWFYWDEFADTYRYIDDAIIDTIIAAKNSL